MFSADLRAIGRHLPWILLFLSPIALLFLLPFVVFVRSGEATPIDTVITEQASSTRTILFGKAYSFPDQGYKIQSTIARRPAVIALGTSRALQFSAPFFKDRQSFFNAGKAVGQVEDLKTFLDLLPRGHEPKLIILALDQGFFFQEHPTESSLAASLHEDPLLLTFVRYAWRQMYADFFQGKFRLRDLASTDEATQAVGMTAFIRHSGYRNDGSYYYGDPGRQAFEVRQAEMLADVDAISSTYCKPYGDTIQPGALDSLKQFLDAAKERNIIVVGVLPPYAHELIQKIRSLNAPCAAMVDRLVGDLRPSFSDRGFELYDFSDVVSVGGSDREMNDSGHASEKSYLRLFLKMVKAGTALKPYAADITTLERGLQDAKDDLHVF